MAEISRLNISAEELSKATSPFHVNTSKVDMDRIVGAYPDLVVHNMMSEFNHKTNEYIVKQLVSLDIDKDVLIKQTEEIKRLNNVISDQVNEFVKIIDLVRKYNFGVCDSDFVLDVIMVNIKEKLGFEDGRD